MFYDFHQNNSGGRFRGPAIIVIIEADDANEANILAENEGIYFDGCFLELDCECCGDRWYRAWEHQAEVEPTIYGRPAHEYSSAFAAEDNVHQVLIVRKDGERLVY